MSYYRRVRIAGGTYFFTVALADRSSDLLVRHVDRLRDVYRRVQHGHPFETLAICILPDHIHALWRMPDGDADYPRRWCLIKGGLSRTLPPVESLSSSMITDARKESGSAAIGSMPFATMPTSPRMSTTFTSTP